MVTPIQRKGSVQRASAGARKEAASEKRVTRRKGPDER